MKKEVEEKTQPVTVMPAKPVKGIKLGGEIEIRYEDAKGEESTFEMANFEPYITVDVDDYFSMKGQLECTTNEVKVNEDCDRYKDLPMGFRTDNLRLYLAFQ